MPDKPVVVYILGGNLDYPRYSDLVALKIASEENGQPFLLIPPPRKKADGKYEDIPEIDLISREYNLDYIKNQLAENFGEKKQFSGREYISLIGTHGTLSFSGYGHEHLLNLAQPYIDSKLLYKALLETNGT